jgi:ABC-type branched-subunit amino acid transport system substrate-binding protein
VVVTTPVLGVELRPDGFDLFVLKGFDLDPSPALRGADERRVHQLEHGALAPGGPGDVILAGEERAVLRISRASVGALASVLVFLSGAGTADSDGEGGETVLLGMSTALSGPAAELGENMRAGVLAAVEEANRAGGMGGLKLELIALDDQYEPAQTVPNMRRLIEQEQVVAVIGNVGTPTAVSAIPIANETKTPFYGAFTGAGVLRKQPPDRYVVNYRASYAEETAAMVDALVGQLGLRPGEVAFFTQRDAYGDAGFVGGIAALKRYGLASEHDVAHGRYERNTLAVEDGLAEVMQADPPPRAVIMVGAYAPCARFIELARDVGVDAHFLNVSFVGAAPLAASLGERGDGVIITQVVPHVDSQVPLVREYRRALTAWKTTASPTFGSLEGYIAARILIRALSEIEGEITRESVIGALEGLGEFDLGLGVPLMLGPDRHQASHTVWPTILRGGRIQPLDWSALSGAAASAVR